MQCGIEARRKRKRTAPSEISMFERMLQRIEKNLEAESQLLEQKIAEEEEIQRRLIEGCKSIFGSQFNFFSVKEQKENSLTVELAERSDGEKLLLSILKDDCSADDLIALKQLVEENVFENVEWNAIKNELERFMVDSDPRRQFVEERCTSSMEVRTPH